jgi:hypothetical protein
MATVLPSRSPRMPRITREMTSMAVKSPDIIPMNERFIACSLIEVVCTSCTSNAASMAREMDALREGSSMRAIIHPMRSRRAGGIESLR